MGKTDGVREIFSGAVKDLLPGDATSLYVAYSGGADSAALLTLMHEYAAEAHIPLTAVHVHHGIRGAEADRDAQACRAFCQAKNIPLVIRYADVPALAEEWSVGMEEAARRVRYEIFEELIGGEAGTFVATAHSADDNLETVLFHMLRGAGTAGMGGIPALRGRYIRPLLGCTAQEIREFCRAEEIPFVVDSTNADDAYTRNYIRGQIVPALCRITPTPQKAVGRMCELLRCDEDYLHGEALRALGENASDIRAGCEGLAPLHDAVLSRALTILYKNAAGGRGNLSAAHVRDLCDLVRRGRCAEMSLPGLVRARVYNGEIAFLTAKEEVPEDFLIPLTEGEHRFPEYGFGIGCFVNEGKNLPFDKNIYKLAICTSLPFDTIQGKAFVRFRRPGDRYRFGGMTRSVKKLLNEAKIPPETRAVLPVFCDENGIFWIPGFPVRDGGATGEKQMTLVCFSL